MRNTFIILLCSLLLINALAFQKIDIVNSADNVLSNTNPVKIIVNEYTYNIPVNDSLKTKLNVVADSDNIVVNMRCIDCHVMFYIVNDESMNSITSGLKEPYELGDVYLESVDSISNTPYQVPTKGEWWVVINNSIESTDVQVNMSLGLQSFQNPGNVSFNGSFGLFSLVSVSIIIILTKKTNKFR